MDNNGGNRAEALRWLSIAEKLLAAHDLYGTRSFAIRARESDPIVLEAADRVIAVADTLLAAESRINNQYDWYGILQINQPTQSIELIATQYRRLALLLHPETNRVAFADHAFRLVSDAWCVLSNPLRKALYDNEYLGYSKFGQGATESSQKPKSPPPEAQFPQPVRSYPRKESWITVEELRQQERPQPQPQQQPQPATSQPLQPSQQRQPQERPQSPQPSQQRQQQERPQPPPPPPQPAQPAQPAEPSQPRPQEQQQQFVRKSTKSTDGKVGAEKERPNVSVAPEPIRETQPLRTTREAESTQPTESSIPSFWTACPYCYNLFEYPEGYEDCVLRCQNCAKAFQAVTIPSPPVAAKDATFCCWGFFPLGVSANAKRSKASATWTPFSAMFTCPLPGQGGKSLGKNKNVNPAKKSAPRFYYEDDDIYVEVSEPSDSSDEEWGRVSRKKKHKKSFANRNERRAQSESLQKGNQGSVRAENADEVEGMNGQFEEQNGMVELGLSNPTRGESSKKAAVAGGGSGRKHKGGKGAKELGKLDLNVEFSNEVEEPATAVSEGHGEDNIEGIAFFEGLDEFLSSLPILNAVADDKVKAG